MKTNGKCADQAGWQKVHSGQYLCYSHTTTSFLLMTKILCAADRRVPLGDLTEQNHNKRFSLR